MHWLKHWFIPHEGNGHQPRFLRSRSVLILLFLSLFIEAGYLVHTYVILPRSDFFAAVLASVLIEQTNEKRVDEHLATLAVDPKLEAAARSKAEDMAASGYFAHNTPDGRTPWWFIDRTGYRYDAAGENLAVNFTESSDVTEAWMHSPLHRANIVNGRFTEIGIATARGVYKGREAVFVVQMFGRPSAPITTFRETLLSGGAIVPPPGVHAPTSEAINPVRPSRAVKLKDAPNSSLTALPVLMVASTSAPVAVAGGSETGRAVAGIADFPIPADALALEPELVPENASVSTASVWEEFVVSPRRVTTGVYVLLGGIVFLALFLAVFIKIRIQYPHLIMNGLLLLAIIAGLGVFNYLLSVSAGVI